MKIISPVSSRWIAILSAVTYAPFSPSVEPMTPYQNSITVGREIRVGSGSFAVVGDTQKTIVPELFLGRESNAKETTFLLSEIAREPVDFLLHLGDMVGNGGSRAAWSTFDRQMDGIVRAGISVLPIVGNHEYMFGGLKNLGFVRERFATMREGAWFTKDYAGIRIIGLNTNKGKLTGVEWDAQARWFSAALADAERDPAIRGVLVFGHHPPYTNSSCVGDTFEVQETFLPPFRASRKALAYFSGHAHGYERFDVDGKAYIISAGGGGPRSPVRVGRKQRHRDLFDGPRVRPFNYLVVTPGDAGVEIVVKGFQKGEREVREVERIELPYERATSPTRSLAGTVGR